MYVPQSLVLQKEDIQQLGTVCVSFSLLLSLSSFLFIFFFFLRFTTCFISPKKNQEETHVHIQVRDHNGGLVYALKHHWNKNSPTHQEGKIQKEISRVAWPIHPVFYLQMRKPRFRVKWLAPNTIQWVNNIHMHSNWDLILKRLPNTP